MLLDLSVCSFFGKLIFVEGVFISFDFCESLLVLFNLSICDIFGKFIFVARVYIVLLVNHLFGLIYTPHVPCETLNLANFLLTVSTFLRRLETALNCRLRTALSRMTIKHLYRCFSHDMIQGTVMFQKVVGFGTDLPLKVGHFLLNVIVHGLFPKTLVLDSYKLFVESVGRVVLRENGLKGVAVLDFGLLHDCLDLLVNFFLGIGFYHRS